MNRLLLTFCGLLLLPFAAWADHITGGEIYYTLLGNNNGNYEYRITVKVFMRCNSGRTFNDPTTISIFTKGTGARVSDHSVYLARTETIQLTDPNKCITDPPLVCYNVGYYEFVATLPPSASGYQIAAQFVYRIAGIRNLVSFYNNIGATYTAEIPANTGNAWVNSSARFVGSDLVAICANNNFSYSFAATDSDGDELRYSFCDAFQGGNFRNGMSVPPDAPPYNSVPYNNAFSGGSPLGPNVKINTSTGLITGTAPDEGVYVVTVCVEEIRNGRVIAVQRKDLQIFIASCTIASASLEASYQLCEASKTLNATNNSVSPLIRTYNWELLDRLGRTVTASTTQAFNHEFADTGLYQLKLVVNRGGECSDSNTAPVRVYPGLLPKFSAEGVCAGRPTQFSDQSTTVYGRIDSWSWDFGSNTEGEAMLSTPSPSFVFRGSGTRQVRLTVATSLGCSASALQPVGITDKPPLNLAFRDTTICIGDEVQLQARSSGNYQWTPQTSIRSGGTTGNAVATPRSTTLFVAQLNQDGCINQDSVLVRVEAGVRLQVSADTTICLGDTVQLRTISNALRYAWQPTTTLLESDVANPFITPTDPVTKYTVTGQIGGCTETASVNVYTVSYPMVNAGADTVICFNTAALLQGSSDGNRFTWSAGTTLSNPTNLSTNARPTATTAYVLTAIGNRGCPKPAYDTVQVRVQAPVQAFAGRDTTVIVGQPLQLQASGGDLYQWTPATGLNDGQIANPIAQYTESMGGRIRYTVKVQTPEGCSDTASLEVRIFETGATVFVPSAFTPNNDGLNDLLRPLAAGMRQLELFSVYNRWGQLVFSSRDGRGWDGTIGGQAQGPGVYVWLVKAVDFNGKPHVQKGTVTLLR
ncbi:T9SS type B sorting domain-containing protein [Pseudocnuella soli]|uniref:T9SS type B sorting domain-containing protein n=1 Tax=Pseudocnuella soli TaxID=2502779 RepID=UPI001052E5F3|nr:gliding motility-associated C-terminal domain-containing protein [Pseudocnuella soli]